jgi:hypothetical protein
MQIIIQLQLRGIKYKLAHGRAEKEKWNIRDNTQRNRQIQVLEELLGHLKSEIDV